VAAFPYEPNHLYADGPLQVAHGEFLSRSRYETTQEKNTAKPLTLVGADEAARHLRPYAEVVLFRLANVLCSVRCDFNKPGTATQAEALARIVLARLLRQRVDRQPLAVKPNLHLEPEGLALSAMRGTNVTIGFPREPASDQQALYLKIENRGEEAAENVRVQWSVNLPGQDQPQDLGTPQEVGRIEAGDHARADTLWNLQGRNVEGAVVRARVYCEGLEDADPADNVAEVKASVYYAHNGNRAFCWEKDSYQFANPSVSDQGIEGMVEAIVATILSNWRPPTKTEEKLISRLAASIVYKRLWDYYRSSATGFSAHCYGMSATMGLYFEDDALRPRPGLTSTYDWSEASPNIVLYHRAQMLPLAEALIRGRTLAPDSNADWSALSAVRESLKDPNRQGLLFSIFGKDAGHAMLAYKLIEVEGRESAVDLADPNWPPARLNPSWPVMQVTVDTASQSVYFPSYVSYGTWARSLAAGRPLRAMPVEQYNDLVNPLKKLIYDLAPTLHRAGQFVSVFRCPVEALFTDAQGRRSGTLDGKPVNEIPGAETDATGEVQIYRLPVGGTYQGRVTATGDGTMDLDVIRALTPHATELKAFEQVPVKKGDVLTLTVQPGGVVGPMQAGDRTVAPDFTGTLSPPSLLGG